MGLSDFLIYQTLMSQVQPQRVAPVPRQPDPIRHDWSRAEVEALFAQPFNDLLFQAQSLHRQYFDPNEVQVSTLLSIKTGACPEDCAYCPQSTRYDTGLEVEKLMEVEKVLEQARAARASGATRFCMGAAWRSPKNRDMPYIVEMVKGVRDLGLESCMTLGMLTQEQAKVLAEAGLDGSYFGGHLANQATASTYKLVLPQAAEGLLIGDRQPSHSGPWETPWRVIVVGRTPSDVAQSNLVSALGVSAVGAVQAPFDAGHNLGAGLRGALFSLPELGFQNIRKGTSTWLVPELREVPMPADSP